MYFCQSPQFAQSVCTQKSRQATSHQISCQTGQEVVPSYKTQLVGILEMFHYEATKRQIVKMSEGLKLIEEILWSLQVVSNILMFISDFWMVFTSEGFSPSVVQSRIFQYCLSISNRSRGSEMAEQERWERDWTVVEEGTELGDGLRKFLRWIAGRNPILSPVLKGFFEVFNALCSLHLPPAPPLFTTQRLRIFSQKRN